MSELKPSRELDALIAKKVMGLRIETDLTMSRNPTGMYLVSHAPFQVAEIPLYSVDIAAAMEVFERALGAGWKIWRTENGWEVGREIFEDYTLSSRGVYPTLPIAICDAALVEKGFAVDLDLG